MNDSQKTTGSDPVGDVVRAARTSREAFGRLFDFFYPPIFAYCARRLLVRAVAEDVTSEVFLKASAHFRDFTGDSSEDFRRWVFRIATNEINAELRKSIRRCEMLEAAARMGMVNASVSTPLLESDFPVDWEDVVRALVELSEREQSIISLRFFAGLQHDEIAAALEIEPGTSRVALTRALNRLRDRLRVPDNSLHSAPRTDRGDP
ncbi:sigma-70 family RNA polymerase sigma factor [bacterium]|nr:sigma-70 family RNA polymerase sigma factor [bacterium]